MTLLYRSTGCKDGYFGYKCQQACSTHCAGKGLCNEGSGRCVNGCKSGYQGYKCVDGEQNFKQCFQIKDIRNKAIAMMRGKSPPSEHV